MTWAPDYCTQQELIDFAHTDDGDAAWIDFARGTASRAIDRCAHRQFGRVAAPEARRYTARWSRKNVGWLVETADLMDLAGVTIAFDALGDRSYSQVIDPSKVDWLPWDAAELGRPWERMLLRADAGVLDDRRGGVRVVAPWGWTAVPVPVHEASLLQGSRLLMRRDSPYGIAGSPEAGSEKRLLARVDPDVEVALAGYVRKTWAR